MTKELILIVEDDGILAVDLMETLKALNFRVLMPVSTGRDAVEAVEKHRPNLVLMDIELPGGMNGIEAAGIIRGMDIPVVFLTGYSQDPLLGKARDTAPYGYLVKPVPERELAATIEIALHRHSLDRKLKESEERYRILVENASEAILVASAGMLVFVNPKTTELLGYEMDEIVMKPFGPFIHPDERDMVLDRHIRRMRGEVVPTGYTFRVLRKDGTSRWVQINAAVIIWEGKPATINILNDITWLKKAEEALRESETLFRSLVDNMQDPVIMIGFDGRAIFGNRAAERLVGIPSPPEGQTVDITPYLSPGSLVQALADLERLKEKGGSVIAELEILNSSGESRWVEGVSVKIPYRGTDVDLVTLRDITDRRLMEEELKLSRANLSALIESTDDFIWSVDREFRLVTYNSKFDFHLKNTYGTTACTGQTPEDRMPPEKAVLWRGYYSWAFEEGPFRIEYVLHDGRVFEMSFNPIIRDGEVTGISVFGKDITEHKKFDEERLKFERQIQQAQKMEAIGSLAGGIAHDFNNILSTIIGNAEMSLEEGSLDNIHYNLRQILSGSVRARDLVRQILTFSRPRKQEQKTMNLKDIVSEAAKLLKATLPSNISIKTHVVNGEHLVYGDPSQIHQVVINLCTNSAHAMSRKGGKLGLELKNERVTRDDPRGTADLADGTYVVLSVSDTGHGIEPSILDKIFDPFFTTKGPGEGTGLGLAVVYGIVNSHGGTITVDSAAGKGSVFRVFLPLTEAGREEEERVSAGGLRGREKILFVDDEPQIVEIVKKALCSLGYDLTVCGNPLQALKLFRKDPERFDLLITDLSMPNMTGKDLARALHKIRPGLPVILSTGHNEMVGGEDLAQFGISELLLKPVSLREYALAVRRVLDGKP
jgi:two-component system, cell cycle sensor histidine kinase and response regulator CckA